MLVIIILVSSDKLIRPPNKPSALDKGQADLSRSLIQATAVASYLALLLGVKPYVHSRLRRWKMWVTAANQGTALLLLLARMLAEQAGAQASARVSVANDTKWAAVDSEPQPAIFMASYVFMYIATLCCMLQFVVLCACFLWSLLEGAKREQVVIVYVAKQKEAARQAKKWGGGNNDEGTMGMIGITMSENPLRHKSPKNVSVDVAPFDEVNARANSLAFAKRSAANLSSLRLSARQGKSQILKEERKRRLTKSSSWIKEKEKEDAARAAEDNAVVAAELAELTAADAAAATAEAAAAEAAAAEAAERRASAAAWWAEDQVAGAGPSPTNIAELEIDPEVDAWTAHVDNESIPPGMKYWFNIKTGETRYEEKGEEVYDEDEEEEEEDFGQGKAEGEHIDELRMVRSRLRSAMQISGVSEDGTKSLADQAYLNLVNDTRGDWIEVCDADGSVLGESLAGHTVYYNRSSYETRRSKPPGWVMMQAQALSREVSSTRAESIKIMCLAASRKSKSKS